MASGLAEVEVAPDVAQDRGALADVGPGIGTAVGRRINSLATEEVVLDEPEVGIERERLIVDVALACVGADDQTRDAQAVPVPADRGRRDMVVEAAPVVPESSTVAGTAPHADGALPGLTWTPSGPPQNSIANARGVIAASARKGGTTGT